MDVETSEAIENLGLRLDRVDVRLHQLTDTMESLGTELRGEIGGLRTELRGEIGGLRTELRGEIGGLRTELRDEIGGLRTELRGEIEASRRHSQMLFESLHDDIQKLAEGFALLSVKLDSRRS